MEKLRIGMFFALALALASGPVGCGDDDSTSDDDDDTSEETDEGDEGGSGGRGEAGDGEAGDGEAGSSGDGESGSGGDGESGEGGSGGSGEDDCPAIEDRDEELIEGEIDADATWSCDTVYILTDLAFVVGDSTLTIEKGTVVQGDAASALIVTRGSQLVTEGTADAPVVFTSSADEGTRLSGDWGGVVMLGAAPINVTGGENRIEGLDPTDDRGLYGGDDDAHDCGSLAYTRIEFAGFELSIDNELNGLTLGGCGADTSVSYVQVHRGFDDGIEIFGGGPTLDHIVLTGNQDDQFDTDFGNVGTVQFLVIQQDPDGVNSSDPQGFEWDNNGDDNDATPRSAPTVYNATLVGANDSAGIQNGIILRRGTWGVLRNLIVLGFPVSALDVRDAASVAGTEEDPPELMIENSLFFENGGDGMTHFPAEPTDGTADDDDAAFVEEDFFTDAARENVFDEDPELGDAYSLTAPDFVPAAGSPAADGAATPPSGFDTSATYMGAFEPGGDDWTEGWTAYPEE
jgi:hypothetical protein